MIKKIFNSIKNILKTYFSKEDLAIWRKILLFLVLFFPYSLYLFIFKTKVNKVIKGIIIGFFIVILILCVDVALYPNRVYNEVAVKTFNEVIVDKNIDVEEAILSDKRSSFFIGENHYFGFNIYSRYSMYYTIFKANNLNKDYELAYISRLDMTDELIYIEEEFKKFKDVDPVIFTHMLSSYDYNYGNEIKKVENEEYKEYFYDIKTQKIITDNGTYIFKYNDLNVINCTNVDKNNNEHLIFEVSDNLNFYTPFNIVYNLLRDNFGDNFEIVGYNYLPITHCFNVVVGNVYYVVEYEYGVGASLERLGNIDAYKEYLNGFIDYE